MKCNPEIDFSFLGNKSISFAEVLDIFIILHPMHFIFIKLCQIISNYAKLCYSNSLFFILNINGFFVNFLWMLFSPVFTIRQIVYCFSAISPNIFRRIFFFFFPRKIFSFCRRKTKNGLFSGFLAVIVGIEDDLNSIFRNRTSSFFDEWFE